MTFENVQQKFSQRRLIPANVRAMKGARRLITGYLARLREAGRINVYRREDERLSRLLWTAAKTPVPRAERPLPNATVSRISDQRQSSLVHW